MEFYTPGGDNKRPWRIMQAKYFGADSPFPRGVDEMRNRERRIRQGANEKFDPNAPPTRCGRTFTCGRRV